jgi:hypothetical protein
MTATTELVVPRSIPMILLIELLASVAKWPAKACRG